MWFGGHGNVRCDVCNREGYTREFIADIGWTYGQLRCREAAYWHVCDKCKVDKRNKKAQDIIALGKG